MSESQPETLGLANHLRIVTSPPGKSQPFWHINANVTDWESFCKWIRKSATAGGKYGRPYSPVSLKPGETRRKNVNLAVRHMLTLDADRSGEDYLDRLAGVLHYLSLSHTTANHTAEEPRWRTLVPVSRAMTPEEAKTLATFLIEMIGRERFDVQASTSPIAVAYAPAWDDVTFHEQAGEVLDVDTLLMIAETVPWKAGDAEGAQTVAEFLDAHREEARGSLPTCLYGRSALDQVAEELGEAVSGTDRVHSTIFWAASRFVEMVSAGCWSPTDMPRLKDIALNLRTEQRPDEWDEALASALERGVKAKSGCQVHGDPFDDIEEDDSDVPLRRSDDRDWLINAILPARSYGILSGPIGSGKSSVACYVVAELTKKGFRVRYCVRDEPEASARHRLGLLDADLTLVTFDDVPDLTSEADMEHYARRCAKAGTDLVVMDLLESANSEYEGNRPEKIKKWTAALVSAFCTKYGMSVLGTHHWNNNTKAGSVMARLSSAGAIAANSEFLWSVAISNDKSEQVWSIHARRRVSKAMNFLMDGTQHIVETMDHPWVPGQEVDLDVYTVAYGADTTRTAHDVAREAEREFVSGKPTSRQAADPAIVGRFLETEGPVRRARIDTLLYWLSGQQFSPQTVTDRLRDAGAVQTDVNGEEKIGGKYWHLEGFSEIGD